MGDTDITNKAFGCIKGARKKAKDALITLHNGTTAFLQEEANQDYDTLRRYHQELIRKWDAYDSSHIKAISTGSVAQLAVENYGENSIAEHNLLFKEQDLALAAIQEVEYQLERADKEQAE